MDSIINALGIVCDTYIFIYSPPKTGTTTLVTSLRISLGKSCNIVHIHDETMLRVLTGIVNITINDIIKHLSSIGKHVYVIDIYRTPIERKMSEFFDKISVLHFNNTIDNINNYSIDKITNRFNKLFPHLAAGDHYHEKYNITTIEQFNFIKKYTLQIINGVTYIKLRLSDSSQWASILSEVLHQDIVIITDYASDNELYKRFKLAYKIPCNLLEMVKHCKYFQFYNTLNEQQQYINKWVSSVEVIPFTYAEYNLYVTICLENQYMADIQYSHYIDNGCYCVSCKNKRRECFRLAKCGNNSKIQKIIHEPATATATATVKKPVKEAFYKGKNLIV